MEQLTYRGIPIVYDESMPVDKPAIELQRAKLPKMRKKRPAVPPAVRAAMDAYTKAYRIVYGRQIILTYDRAFGFIRGATSQGVGHKRLKEMTAQLRERAKDL